VSRPLAAAEPLSGPVLVAACRTPIGTAGHGLADVTVVDLAAPVLAESNRRVAALDLPVSDVILGNCLGPGGNIARSAALAAGLGVDIPGVTVDRQCGSGLEAVRLAAMAVQAAGTSGMTPSPAPLILAGGAESASTAPWRFWPPSPSRGAGPGREPGPAELTRYHRAPFAPPGFADPEMGPAADALAARRGIGRARQDEYAARSHARALAAAAAGAFVDELVAVGRLAAAERPRPNPLERLRRLPAAFAAHLPAPAGGRPAGPSWGTVTAGNASGISDGAAVVAVTTERAAADAGLPACRVLSSAVVAGDPALPGAGAGPAALLALRQAGVSIAEISVIEVVEAFASVALAFADDLDIDAELLCLEGGAVALGHPWGASGAVALVRAVSQLHRDPAAQFGLVACALGGGQGIAMVIERCEWSTSAPAAQQHERDAEQDDQASEFAA
jgi:acetyl-CoA C-acetyltransferase